MIEGGEQSLREAVPRAGRMRAGLHRLRGGGVRGALLLALLCAAGAGGATAAVLKAPAVPRQAVAKTGEYAGEPQVEGRLLLEPAPSDSGQALRLGLLLDLNPGWHTYWKNPGESGLPIELDIQAPGARIAPLSWPVPRSYSEAEGMFTTYGYPDQVLLTTVLHWSDPAPQRREIEVEANFLICQTECIPAALHLKRVWSPEETPASPASLRDTRALFDYYAARVPVAPAAAGVELGALYSQSGIRPNDAFEAAIRVSCAGRAGDIQGPRCGEVAASAQSAQFFPADSGLAKFEALRVLTSSQGDGDFVVSLEGTRFDDFPGEAGAAAARLSGVLRFDRGAEEVLALEVDLPFPVAEAGAEISLLGSDWFQRDAGEGASPAVGLGLLHALALAFLGGLLLNLMPCVLPILAIKVFAVAEMAKRSRAELAAHGLAYTTGVLATLLSLAIVVLLLRQAGSLVGWGFQFQEPLFVAAVATLVVGFALNLFGVFEITVDAGSLAGVGQQATGLRRSFFDGLLGVILATPCSAPFLGTAVGFAFASSGWVIVAIFLTIGLGLAAPFALISLVPGAARWVPRSGAWMEKLRTGLGFSLLATAVWLLWVYGRSVGLEAMIGLLAFLLAMSFVLWLYGSAQAGDTVWLRRGLAAAALITVVLGLAALRVNGVAQKGANVSAMGAALPFDAGAVAKQLSEGNPVFVYFTADWCITCKLNERVVLADPQVQKELERLGVVSFKGDWTQRDETIRAELARFGKAGVPLYLVYDPQKPAQPSLLPELLTVDLLVDALQNAATLQL